MPLGFSSAPRNLFLFGSAGTDVVTNFFKTINQSAGTDEVFVPDEIRYNYTDKKYVLAGSAADSNSKNFGWFEKRDDTGTADWDVRIEAGAGVNTTLRAMELDGSNNLIVVGTTGDNPWIAKYSNGGVIDWQSTTFSGDVTYTGVSSDSSGNYYACGNTPESGEAQAFVEKYATNGTPDWSKSAFMLGRDVVLNAIDSNSRGEVVAVGHLEDDTNEKGYIFKIDTTTGDIMWDRTLTLDGVDIQCTDIFIDINDQIYVTASTDTYGYLLKYTAEGNMIWQKRSNQSSGTIRYNQVHSDGETEQTVVFAKYDDGNDTVGLMSKYTKSGDLVWRRTLTSSFNNSDTFSNLCLDADPSFYYFLYTDSPLNLTSGTPDKYTFGKVSSSGNGLGSFQYNEGTGQTIDYNIVSIGDVIGRLSDGSVRNDSSDLITYPFTANNILFDDLATHVSNKRRQMDGPDSFEYGASGSAIRTFEFQQELNLLGDVYSGSGDWLDQSGKGNDATTSFITGAIEPFSGAGSIEFDGSGDSISVGQLLPTSTGTAFTVDMFWRSTSNSSQKCLWEQHNSGSGRTAYFVDGTNAFLISEGNTVGSFAYSNNVWYFTRVTYTAGGAIEVFVDGVSRGTGTQTVGVDNVNFVIGTRSGQTEEFNGYISNFRVITGSALSGAGQVPTSALTNTGQTNDIGTIQFGFDNSDNTFDTSSTSVTYNSSGLTYNTWSGSQLMSGLGGFGANSVQVWKTSNLSEVDWTISTDTSDRYIFTSSDGQNWTSPGTLFDTDTTPATVTTKYLATGAGANVSTITVSGVGSGTTGTMLLTAQGGSITDASDSNLSITVNGDAAALVGSTNGPTYNAAGYWEFDGTDDYMSVGSIGDWNFLHNGSSDWTIEYWIYSDVSNSRKTVVSTGGNSSAVGFTARVMETGSTGGGNGTKLSAQISRGSGGNYLYWDSDPTTITNNQWYHVTNVFKSSSKSLEIYLDSVLTNGSNDTGTVSGSFGSGDYSSSDSFAELLIGKEPYGSSFDYDGKNGEVRIYPRALTAAQVYQNYNATKETYTGVAASTNPGLTSTRTP